MSTLSRALEASNDPKFYAWAARLMEYLANRPKTRTGVER